MDIVEYGINARGRVLLSVPPGNGVSMPPSESAAEIIS